MSEKERWMGSRVQLLHRDLRRGLREALKKAGKAQSVKLYAPCKEPSYSPPPAGESPDQKVRQLVDAIRIVHESFA